MNEGLTALVPPDPLESQRQHGPSSPADYHLCFI